METNSCPARLCRTSIGGVGAIVSRETLAERQRSDIPASLPKTKSMARIMSIAANHACSSELLYGDRRLGIES
jgi:hypothetical protein